MLNKITSLSPYVLGGGAGIPQWKGHLGVPLRCGFLSKFLDPVTFYIDAAVHDGPEVDDLEATKLQQGGKEATELIDGGGGTEKRDDRPEIADKDQGPPGEADEGQE